MLGYSDRNGIRHVRQFCTGKLFKDFCVRETFGKPEQSPLGELKTTAAPSYHVDEDYPAGPEIQ